MDLIFFLGLINTGLKLMRSAFKALENSTEPLTLSANRKADIEKTKRDLIQLNNHFITNKKTYINDLIVVNQVETK